MLTAIPFIVLQLIRNQLKHSNGIHGNMNWHLIRIFITRMRIHLILCSGYYMIKKENLAINGKQLNNLNAKIRFSDAFSYGDSYSGDVNLILYGANDLNQVSNILSASDLTSLTQTFNQQYFSNLLSGTISENSVGDIQWNANLEITTDPNAVGLPGGGLSTVVSGANNSEMIGLGPLYSKALGCFLSRCKATGSIF